MLTIACIVPSRFSYKQPLSDLWIFLFHRKIYTWEIYIFIFFGLTPDWKIRRHHKHHDILKSSFNIFVFAKEVAHTI